MFKKKKKCDHCKSNVAKKFDFCPYCGHSLVSRAEAKKQYGLLGKNDQPDINELSPGLGGIGGIGGGMLDKMLKGAIKMLEKEMQKEIKNMDKNMSKNPNNIPTLPKNFQLYINGKKVNISPQTTPTTIKRHKRLRKKQESEELPMPTEKTILSAKKLPRKEAKSELKRISNKVVYEIEAPIASLEKVLINKVEEGYEIRVFTKSAVLTKNIQITLPLIAHYLKNKKLFLEFEDK
jgi:hypothetical protein